MLTKIRDSGTTCFIIPNDYVGDKYDTLLTLTNYKKEDINVTYDWAKKIIAFEDMLTGEYDQFIGIKAEDAAKLIFEDGEVIEHMHWSEGGLDIWE
ncbi:hypothetical protein FACS1894188_07260 [Clostridia bacterium]|nr:hypothetical protein FACS1894188_07260 [Clostridia bacterium]